MTTDLHVLALDAIAVAFIHTVIGPDHYVPFIVMAKARQWSLMRTAIITIACGIGHVTGSIALGMIGYGLGSGLRHLQWIESMRGEIAAWSLIAFGGLYAAWGLWRMKRSAPDGHSHDHLIRLHAHDHIHHPKTGEEISLTPWILFAIFVFGPCEPLIPLFIYPAATSGWAGALLVTAAFSVTTIGSMLVLVLAAQCGLQRLPAGNFARYNHILAGSSIALTGVMIRFLGL